MAFEAGNKVTIVAKEQRFYRNLYNLRAYSGTVTKSNFHITEVFFSNKPYSVSIITKDLNLGKNQQLLFSFME